MSFFLFIDESGQDQRESPNEVLAGLAIEDRVLWPFINAIQSAEVKHFGTRYSDGERELKGRKLLSKKVFRLAEQLPAVEPQERSQLAYECLTAGEGATLLQITALAQSKLAFVERVLEICQQYECRAFAGITSKEAPRPARDGFLRKDYAYLFQRFYNFLQDPRAETMGIVVFDELDRSQSHILVDQMSKYFLKTGVGRERSARVIPEPFFVHSDLTTAIQVVDVMAYIVAWGVQIGRMRKPVRTELSNLAKLVLNLRYQDQRSAYTVWGFFYLTDLRPRTAWT